MTHIHSNTVNENVARSIIHDILRADNLPPAEKKSDRVNNKVDTITSTSLKTIAQTLRFILYHLYNNSILLHRLPTELRDLLSTLNTNPQDEPTLTQPQRLPYLTAVITEAVGLSLGVANQLTRIVPDRELVPDGNTVIPTGTPVSMTDNTVSAPGDERAYPEAQYFEPERLDGQGEGEEGREDVCTIFQDKKENLSWHAVSHEPISFFLCSQVCNPRPIILLR